MSWLQSQSRCSPGNKSQPITYLVSEYPAVSHTFIQREVAHLRAIGHAIETVSINRSHAQEVLDPAAQAEVQQTYYLKADLLKNALQAHFRVLRHTPRGYLAMLAGTLRLKSLRALAYFVEAGLLLDHMRSQNSSHVHVHFANAAGTVAYLASLTGLCTFSLSVHGPDVFDDVYHGALPNKLNNALFVRSISHYCTAQVRRWMPYENWKKIHIVRCGVHGDFPFLERPASGPAKILCVGRLCSAKGQHQLLSASRSLLDMGIDHHLTLVGGGPDESSLKDLTNRLGLGRYVTFTGPLGQGSVQELYAKSDLFVLPSYAEGVPVVLMEAMARALPVVTTRIAGIPELVEHERTGLLVTPADQEELVSTLAGLIKDPLKRKELGEQGRAFVSEHYDLYQQLDLMSDLFKQYLGGKHV